MQLIYIRHLLRPILSDVVCNEPPLLYYNISDWLLMVLFLLCIRGILEHLEDFYLDVFTKIIEAIPQKSLKE